jgi:hypothetical protein
MLISELHASDVSISLNNKNLETRKPESDCLNIFLNLFKDTGHRTCLLRTKHQYSIEKPQEKYSTP